MKKKRLNSRFKSIGQKGEDRVDPGVVTTQYNTSEE